MNMQIFSTVFVCGALLACGRRLHTASHMQHDLYQEQFSQRDGNTTPMLLRLPYLKPSRSKGLASSLLAFNPAALDFSALSRSSNSLLNNVNAGRSPLDNSLSRGSSPVALRSFWSSRRGNDLDLERVVERFKADIPNSLRQEPDWGIYAEDFQVVDEMGPKLQGLGTTKLFSYLFRGLRNVVIVEDDVLVSVVDGQEIGKLSKPCFVVRWKVRLERPPPYEVWKEEYAVNFEVDTIFQLNDKNEVAIARVNKMLFNGRQFDMWPDLKLSDNPIAFVQNIRQWVMSLVMDMPELEPFRKIKEWAQDIKTTDLSASPIIRRWKSIAATAERTVPSTVDDVEKAKLLKKMDGAQTILEQMADDIECATVDEILALVFNAEGSEADLLVNIYAMATATQNTVYDSEGRLKEIARKLGLREAGLDAYEDDSMPVVEIGELVAMPTSQRMGPLMGGLGKELLIRIVRRAAALGRLVTISPANDQLEEYYESLGFERIDSFGREMVYSKPLPEVTDKEGLFEMDSLRVE